MALTDGEVAALVLMGPEGIRRAIRERESLRSQMVGTLYPEVLGDEIAELRGLLDEVTRDGEWE